MNKQVTKQIKERKIFLNCMNSWFSNFVIEEFRTDYLPDAKIQNKFMGTMDASGAPLPRLFEPKETSVEIGYNYNQEIFTNDVLIYNLDDSNLAEVEFVIRGLKNIKYTNEKVLILVSNIMTWADTPNKIYTEEEINAEGFSEEEVPEIIEEKPLPTHPEVKTERENAVEEEKAEEQNKEKDAKEAKDAKDGKDAKDNKNPKDKNKKDDKNNKDKNKDKEKDKKDEPKKGTTRKESKNSRQDKENKPEKPEEEKLNTENNPEKPPEEQVAQNPEEKKKEEEKPEIPKIRYFYYKDEEYQKRIPNNRYFKYKILESLALSNSNPMLKVYIVCPGFIYGCGENFFFDYYRLCWLGVCSFIPIIGEGMNYLPTIHILDLVHLLKKIIENKPIKNYILATDKTKNPTMKNIITSISKAMGNGQVKCLTDFNIDEIDIPLYTELSIDVKIKASNVMEDESEKVKFNWHCEYGIPENLALLREEFNLYRGIKPIKIIILGPPCGGKTLLSEKIAKSFKISHLLMNDIVEWAKSSTNALGDEAREKWKEIEEAVTKALDEYEHRKNKRKNDPPLDTSQIRKYSPEFFAKIMREKLLTGECAGKGYVLDGYPKTYEDCVQLYTDTETNTINQELLPDSVVIINDYTEESLKRKLENIPDYQEKQVDMNNRFSRRILKYKTSNEVGETNPKLVQDFYTENNIDIYYLSETKFVTNKEEEESKMHEYLERNGPIDNFAKLHDTEEIIPFKNEKALFLNDDEKMLMNTDEIEGDFLGGDKKKFGDIIKEDDENSKENSLKDVSQIQERKVEDDLTENNENNKSKNDNKNNDPNANANANPDKKENKKQIIEKSESKTINDILTKQEQYEKNIQDKLNEMKIREKNLLERKSEVLRRYLSENVIPLLAKGILNVCQNMPDDPVDALANYLLDHSFNANLKIDDENKANELEKIMNESGS